MTERRFIIHNSPLQCQSNPNYAMELAWFAHDAQTCKLQYTHVLPLAKE